MNEGLLSTCSVGPANDGFVGSVGEKRFVFISATLLVKGHVAERSALNGDLWGIKFCDETRTLLTYHLDRALREIALSKKEATGSMAGYGRAMSLLADYNLPFAIALGIMLLLAALQVTGIADLDTSADVDAGVSNVGMMGALTTLLGVGRVPFFVWLMVLLFLFAGLGVSIQGLAQNLTGRPLGTWLGGAFALIAAVPLTSVLVRPLAWMIPRDETSAVGLDSLVGRRAVITTGRAAKGYPARAKVHDRHGHPHHVMVEPHEEASEMLEGDEGLLVRREGQIFFAVPLSERRLAPVS